MSRRSKKINEILGADTNAYKVAQPHLSRHYQSRSLSLSLNQSRMIKVAFRAEDLGRSGLPQRGRKQCGKQCGLVLIGVDAILWKSWRCAKAKPCKESSMPCTLVAQSTIRVTLGMLDVYVIETTR